MPQTTIDRQAVTQGMSMASLRADEIEAVAREIEARCGCYANVGSKLAELRSLAGDLRCDLKRLGECID